jgi:hypothetical protein
MRAAVPARRDHEHHSLGLAGEDLVTGAHRFDEDLVLAGRHPGQVDRPPRRLANLSAPTEASRATTTARTVPDEYQPRFCPSVWVYAAGRFLPIKPRALDFATPRPKMQMVNARPSPIEAPAIGC